MRKNLPIILFGSALIVLILVSCLATPPNPENTPAWRTVLAWPAGAATLGVLLTLFFIAWQAILMRHSVSAADEASKRELRAYLGVVIGSALFQQRRPQNKGGDLKFECRPLLVNNGRTPARKIIFKARAAIMPIPLPKETNLPDAPDEGIGGNILGAGHNANMFAIVEGFCADNEVAEIKKGNGTKGLYTWGRITYEDVFGESHFTLFCQHIYWDPDGKVGGHYIPGRNDAS
jgi:hypothetical protein